jgi:hypothetical protein
VSALRVRRVLVIPPYGAPPHGPQSQLSIDISLAAIAQELEARGVPTPAGQGSLGAYASLAAAGGLRVFECSTWVLRVVMAGVFGATSAAGAPFAQAIAAAIDGTSESATRCPLPKPAASG